MEKMSFIEFIEYVKDKEKRMQNKIFDLIETHDENRVKIKQATKAGYILCDIGGVADLSFPTSKLRRGRVQGNGWICPTLTTSSTGIYRIEKQESTEQQGG